MKTSKSPPETDRIPEDVWLDYAEWKGWTADDAGFSSVEQFRKEIKRAEIKPRSKILELGFGDGGFLDWAKRQGHEIVGVEINEEFCEWAKERGHNIYHGDLNDIQHVLPSPFDAIVIFDVLEHLTDVELLSVFSIFHNILRPNGVIVARFPNGVSPFGRIHQYGDITHRTCLSGNRLQQIGSVTGFRVVRVCNAARSYFGGARRGMFLPKLVIYGIRFLVEVFVGFVYFSKIYPLDPNITVFMRRNEK